MSCANSVLPVFMTNPSPRHRRGEPPAIQIRPSNEVLKTTVCQWLTGKLGSTNRTLVTVVHESDSRCAPPADGTGTLAVILRGRQASNALRSSGAARRRHFMALCELTRASALGAATGAA